ncbi:MAG TPA: UbiH/UbiF/VisC/COQ6 family ubiquinone biosynthesis hydroxylase [Gammaproteobacteria bacterium]|nr:UbiH/UbiF/VisC/COQ6 family ubiquinone biosynthesis hydroxylase [Gammaproteobacteria bacterium]
MNPSEFDIIILGGGLVGLTAANLCAQHGFSVALVERQEPPLIWEDDHFDIRCSAISKASQILFQEMGIWDSMIKERVSAYQRMHVWDALGFGEITFDAAEVGEADLGHIIENRAMQKALWTHAKQSTKVHFFIPANPMALHVEPEHIFLTLNDQTNLKAKLIIGADGGHSWLREYIGIESKQHDYHQSALVATVRTELSHQQTAWQRFLPEGPLAFLPLNSGKSRQPNPYNLSSIVWTSTTEKTKILMSLTEVKFCEELAHAFDYRLGSVLSTAERRAFSLSRMHANHYIANRVALIGDAIHVIHPLAGQGVNLGLGDAQKLVETLFSANKRASDIGHHLVLRKYERARKGQILSTLLAMDFLNRTFTREDTLSLGLRSIGLNFVDKTAFLKKKMMLQAMGL